MIGYVDVDFEYIYAIVCEGESHVLRKIRIIISMTMTSMTLTFNRG